MPTHPAAKSGPPITAPGIDDALRYFDQLPDSAFIRAPIVRALCGGISNTTLWRWVQENRLPKPEKLGPQVTAWNVGALRRAREAAHAA
jgi:predicted DNA-binding transcriptional regulator AlpA